MFQLRKAASSKVNLELPMGQYMTGKVVDGEGTGIPEAIVQVRYHEPGKAVRRAAFDPFERTDAEGLFLLRAVGVDVNFVVDVLAPGYLPKSSKRFKRSADDIQLDDIVLDERGGAVHVEVLDSAGSPVGETGVYLSANPAGYESDERGSLLHGRVYNQQAQTSSFGNVRFARVPPGKIRMRAFTPSGSMVVEEATVADNEQLRLSLRLE